jgi:hypothetical protein
VFVKTNFAASIFYDKFTLKIVPSVRRPLRSCKKVYHEGIHFLSYTKQTDKFLHEKSGFTLGQSELNFYFSGSPGIDKSIMLT